MAPPWTFVFNTGSYTARPGGQSETDSAFPPCYQGIILQCPLCASYVFSLFKCNLFLELCLLI